MKIYQQAGHNTNWNLESLEQDGAGDGIIFSPVHYKKDNMVGVASTIKEKSLFDPQFYIPDSQKAKLHSYDFFPEKITDGFSTVSFEAIAHKAAEQCLAFQLENNYEAIIIPARYYSDLVTDYIEKQKAFSVEPFLNEISRLGVKKDIFVSLPITVKMTQDRAYRLALLNWITSYPEIQGVYLLNDINESTKQIRTYEVLNSYIDFILDLNGAGLKTILGYCNTESILLSTIMPYAVTIGAYENTRNFSVDKFLQDDSDKRGPAPRVYMPKLLNWVRYDTVKEIKDDLPTLWEKIYTPTTHMESLFDLGERPTFNKPGLYKHHFQLINSQLKELSALDRLQRIASVESMIEDASSLYREIKEAKVMFFDDNCEGLHLPIWNRIVRKIKS